MYDDIELPSVVRWMSRLPLPGKLGVMNRLFGKALRRRGVGWVTVYTGHKWLIDLRNPCHRWMIYGYYADPCFLRWCFHNVPENGVIVDSGANIGQFVPYFSEVAPKGRVLAFEPSSVSSDWLCRSVARNENLPVETVQKGLSDECTQAFIKGEGGDEVKGLWDTVSKEEQNEGERIRLTTLDDEVVKRKIDRVSLWKLDVEGHELPALKGATDLLSNKRVDVLYIEMKTEADNNAKIISFMSEMGYDYYLFDAWGQLKKQDSPSKREVDGVFLPRTS